MNTAADFVNNLEFHKLLAPRKPAREFAITLGEPSVLTAYLPQLAGALENVTFGGAESKCLRGDDSQADGGIHVTVAGVVRWLKAEDVRYTGNFREFLRHSRPWARPNQNQKPDGRRCRPLAGRELRRRKKLRWAKVRAKAA
jgi:hypothetical protein